LAISTLVLGVKRKIALVVCGILKRDVDVRELRVIDGLGKRLQVHPVRDVGDDFVHGVSGERHGEEECGGVESGGEFHAVRIIGRVMVE